jgi:hypothetical protein
MGKLINKYVSIGGIDRIVEISGAETITDKTLTAPTLNTPTVNNSLLATPRESWDSSNTAITTTATTVNLNPKTAGKSAWLYNGNSTATFSVNVGHADDNTNDDSLKLYLGGASAGVGQSITISLAIYVTNSACRLTGLTIDGASHTVYWQGGISPAAGSGSVDAYDVYTFTIIKTATTPSYVIFASKTEFDN